MFFLAPVHLLSAWTTVIWLTFLPASTDTQRTYRRQCDCEYMVDGRCAYTLLLPTSTAADSTSSPVCPTTSSSTSSPAVADQQIEFLQGNVSQLRTWVGNQANELIDVQQKVRDVGSAVGSLRDTVERLNASWLNQCPPGCNGSSSGSSIGATSTDLNDVVAQLSAQRSRTDLLQAAVDRLNRTVEDLSAACSQGRCGSPTAPSVGTSTISNPVPLLNEEELERRIRQELTTKYWLCAARGLLVSGNRRNVADASIAASGHLDESSSAARVRINTTNGTGNSGNESSGGAWCAANSTTDANQTSWIQFDLGNTSVVFAVVTRGRAMSDDWVTSYRLEYSTADVTSGDASVTWTSYVDVIGNAEIFAGNTDADTLHINNLWQPISARFVRLVPLESHGAVCLRADVIGCVD